MIGNLTVKEMLAARMLVENHTQLSVLEKCEVSHNLLKAWMEKPEFQAYQEVVREEHNKFLQAATQVERKKYKITLAGIVEKLEQMAEMPVTTDKVTVRDKLEIYKYLVDVLQLKSATGAGESATAEPDVYQAAWMNRTPQ